MTDTTATDRQARYKARQRAEGKRQITLWVTDIEAEAIRRYLEGTVPLPGTLPGTDAVTRHVTSNVTSNEPDPAAPVAAPSKAELAEQACELHRKGYSYAEIAAKWTKAGIPTLRGGKWHSATIHLWVSQLEEGKR